MCASGVDGETLDGAGDGVWIDPELACEVAYRRHRISRREPAHGDLPPQSVLDLAPDRARIGWIDTAGALVHRVSVLRQQYSVN